MFVPQNDVELFCLAEALAIIGGSKSLRTKAGHSKGIKTFSGFELFIAAQLEM